jgi:restriction endonuclease S subunit
MQIKTYQGEHKIEYSIVNLNEVEGVLRIDAEYFDPVYLRNEKLIEKKKWACLKDLSKEIINFGAYSLCNLIKYQKRGVPYLFVGNIKENEIDTNSIKHINKKIHDLLYKSKIYSGDIVFTIAGTIGNAAVVPDKLNNTNSNQAIAKIRDTVISPFYTSTFLNSKYGKCQSCRFIVSNVQPNLLLTQVKNLKIPIPSGTFQKQIEKLVSKAHGEKQKANTLYKEAEDILLEKLGLKNWKPKNKKINIDGKEFEEEENISIRRSSECLEVNRFDAEYWLPRYDEIENLIKNSKGGFDNLPNLINISKEKIKIASNENYNYIELADINSNIGTINQIEEIIGANLPSRAKMKINKGYVLMSSIEGSINKIALVDFEKNNLVASTGFFIFKENRLNKETGLVLLKSLSNLYIKREAQGTILTAIPNTSLGRIILPKVNLDIQSIISRKIEESFKSRRKSKELLEMAKRGVEIYIENDEQKGINYITEQL